MSVGMLKFVFVVIDAVEFEDCVRRGHGARGTGQRADRAGVEFA